MSLRTHTRDLEHFIVGKLLSHFVPFVRIGSEKEFVQELPAFNGLFNDLRRGEMKRLVSFAVDTSEAPLPIPDVNVETKGIERAKYISSRFIHFFSWEKRNRRVSALYLRAMHKIP